MKILLLLVATPLFSFGKITTEIIMSDRLSEQSFDQITLHRGNYLADTANCGIISLKLFYPPEHKRYPPSGPWLCLFPIDVIRDGYGPGRSLSEKVYFDKETGLWKKEKYNRNREEIQRSLEVYGIKSLNELRPVDLYNIQSVNGHGYVVIDSNIPIWEKQKGVKKISHSA